LPPKPSRNLKNSCLVFGTSTTGEQIRTVQSFLVQNNPKVKMLSSSQYGGLLAQNQTPSGNKKREQNTLFKSSQKTSSSNARNLASSFKEQVSKMKTSHII
jgi:hypothetical protein